VTFSIAMDPATINSASFTVTTGATPVAGTVSYDPVTFTASFLPDVALEPLSEYTVSISALTPDGGICPPGSVDASWTFTSLAPPP
jgi:type IV pilus assembly protein PilY1